MNVKKVDWNKFGHFGERGKEKDMKRKIMKMLLAWGMLVSILGMQIESTTIIHASDINFEDVQEVAEMDEDVPEETGSEENVAKEAENEDVSEESGLEENAAEQVENEDAAEESGSKENITEGVEVEENLENDEEFVQEIEVENSDIGDEVSQEGGATEEESETADFSAEVGSAARSKYIAKGTNGGLTWSIDDKGHFVLEGTEPADEEYAEDWLIYTDEIESAFVNISGVTSTHELFAECINLKSIDFGKSDFSQVTDMSGMFQGCWSLSSLNLKKFNTSKVVDMGGMFWDCYNLKSLDLSSFNTSKVVDMSGMFWACSGLKSLDLSSFNTSKVENMGSMFGGMAIKQLNLSKFNTSNVKNMRNMFQNCSELQKINLSSFNTSKVTDMSLMFSGCMSLQSIDLSRFVVSSRCNVDGLLLTCISLDRIKTIPNLTVTIKIPERELDSSSLVDSSGNKYTFLPKNKKHSILLVRKKPGSFCTATFNPNGGKVSEKTRSISVGETYGVLPSASRSGYNFTGWYTAKNGGKKISATTKVSKKEKITLYAHWTVKTSIKKADIKVNACTYNGKRQKPAVVVKLGKKTLKENKDFTVKYSNNINAGNVAVVTIAGKGRYHDSTSKKFKISPLSIEKKAYIKLAKDSYTWDGKEKKPGVAVYAAITLPGSTVVTLQNKKDYTYKYKNNKEIGKASVIITGKGNYSGTKTISYKINKAEQPAKVNLKTLKKTYNDVKKSYAITVSEKKESAKVTYTSSNKKVADVSKNKIVLKGCGKATISVKFAETKHYKVAEKKISVTVLKKQDVTTKFKNGAKVAYTTSPISLETKAKGKPKLSYESSNNEIAVVDKNGNLILKNAKRLGTVKITIKAQETAEYVSEVEEIKITTEPGIPVINYSEPNQEYYFSGNNLNLNAKSEVPIFYQISDASIAQVDARGIVTFLEWSDSNELFKTVEITISSKKSEFYEAVSKKISLKVKKFNPNSPDIFLKQKQGFTCTLCSAAMMLRRRAGLDGKVALDGKPLWESITEESIESDAWINSDDGGLKSDFICYGMHTRSVGFKDSDNKKNVLITMLKSHPEGLIIYNTNIPHAVLLTDYDDVNDIFYCADPDTNPQIEKGRIPLIKSSIATRCGGTGNQDIVINSLAKYWFIE